MAEIGVELLGADAAKDHELVRRLTRMVNVVYADAEEGIWKPGSDRTNAEGMSGLIGAGEIAVAGVDGELVGAVRIQAVAEDTGEFGMLVADPDRRGIGIGRELVRFAEGHYREHGMRAMQLELLVPREWEHPHKVFLDGWYRRIGYRVVRTTTLDESYPELEPLLATPCKFVIYEKGL
jgi:GNAT superfamily N-acetyltransferase